jgi:monofunctional glycosyltransferase
MVITRLILGFRPEAGVVGVLLAVALMLVFAFGVSWIWIIVGMLVQTPESVMTSSFLLLFPLTFASNIFVDPATMPGWLQTVVGYNPVTHLATVTRGPDARRRGGSATCVGARRLRGDRGDLRAARDADVPAGAVVGNRDRRRLAMSSPPAAPRRRGRRRRRGRWLRRLALLALALALAPLPAVVVLRWVAPPTTSFMIQSPVRPVSHRWLAWEAIPAHVRLAVVAAEDQRFPLHRGFDVEAIREAIADNRARVRPRGASTITQQVAKNLFLWPGGGYLRKGAEAWITVLIELAWPKRRILDVYLNVAEMGPGVYGVEAAAWRWFDRPATTLGRREAALLAAILPSPRQWRPDAPPPHVARRARWIEGQMANLGDGWLAEL